MSIYIKKIGSSKGHLINRIQLLTVAKRIARRKLVPRTPIYAG
uniref:Uncharacterized protein n=1 Tax=Arundo donax TaxID=35708 RepID=A0A0A9HX54_ARUDO